MKTKNISITDKHFESLLRAVAIAGSIYGVMSDMMDEKYKKQAGAMDEIEKILSGYAYGFGLDRIVEDHENEQVIDMQSDWYDEVMDDIFEYDEYATFDTLSNKLGWRDFKLKYTQEEIDKMASEHSGYLGVPLYDFENKYYEEFNENDYERLYIDKSK